MKRLVTAFAVTLLGLGSLGCTGGAKPPAAVAVPSPTPTDPVVIAAGGSPEKAVDAFLKALQSGKPDVISGLLTDTARAETAKHGMEIKPESVPNAAYKVVEAVYPPEDPGVAHVSSLWAEGEEQVDIIWVLRQERHGWRIAGMAMPIAAGQDPVFLNFEVPEEMLQVKEQMAYEAEVAAMQQQQQQSTTADAAPPAANGAGGDTAAPTAQTPALETVQQNPSPTISEETSPIRSAELKTNPIRK